MKPASAGKQNTFGPALRFNVTLTHDANEVVREYAISAFDPAPRHLQMIGLVSGSRAQVIAANQEVQDFTIVEIDPAATDPENIPTCQSAA